MPSFAAYGPRQAKMCLRACAKCSDPDSSHACAKYYPGRCSQFLHSVVPTVLLEDGEGPDQNARICRLIWAFAVRICPKTRFRMARHILHDDHFLMLGPVVQNLTTFLANETLEFLS